MILRFIIGVVLMGALTGCATTKQPTAVNHLQIRVAQIESRLDEQDREVAELRFSVEDLGVRVQRAKSAVKSSETPQKMVETSAPKTSEPPGQPILRVPVAPKEVQTALQNAGYYKGPIDGKLGSGSKKAIKAFQKDHDLEGDGIVGKKTWAELKHYIE